MRNTEFICIFTTGRSGTAFLSQAFGCAPWRKRILHVLECGDGYAMVTHERWTDFPMHALKTWNQYTPRALQAQRQFIRKWIDNDAGLSYPVKYLVTDHRVGRYFAPCLPTLPKPGKVIYVRRDPDEVVASFASRLAQKRDRLDADAWDAVQHNFWNLACYSPTEPDTIHHVPVDEWEAWPIQRKLRWYCNEVHSRWQWVKSLAHPGSYLEVMYEDLHTGGLDQIAAFTGLSYAPELCANYVNERKL